jgi:DNA helicase-2/ATP-dependent DNA helicase PcrA
MRLSTAQRVAARCDRNTLVVACPGSGKTRTLVAKLLYCLEEARCSSRRIACITYTNAAAHEVEKRLRAYGAAGDEHHCDISTIHAFCLENVLRHFHWRLHDYADGFRVLPPDSDRYRELAADVLSDHALDWRARDRFELLGRERDGTPIVAPPLTQAAALDFWDRIQREGFIDFPNIIYSSYRLMSEWPSIAHAVACRYSWILVDEFQDTTELQVEILRLVAARNVTRFFLVGDPCQSIFGFAGARPELMTGFAEDIDAEQVSSLLDNYRSSQSIIEQAERLFPRHPPMMAVGDLAACRQTPVYVHADTAYDAITECYLPLLEELGIPLGDSAVLAPWWVKLLHLGRRLREDGIPIIGPGARPYKRSHLFGRVAEQVCAYVEHPVPGSIPLIERELFGLLTDATGAPAYEVYSYGGRTVVFRLARLGARLRDETAHGLSWLRSAAEEFADVLCDASLLPESRKRLLAESVDAMEADMRTNGMDPASLSTEDLGMFASRDRNLKLLTMHKAKGREFQAVAIIDLHDGRVPHYSARTTAEIEEAKRLLYVAITRAKRVLVYVTDNENRRNTPSRFLGRDGLGLLASPNGDE